MEQMGSDKESVIVSGRFDPINLPTVRFLEQAARHGRLHVYLWPDEAMSHETGHGRVLAQEERAYFLQALRYVWRVTLGQAPFEADSIPHAVIGRDHSASQVPGGSGRARAWIVREDEDSGAKRAFCAANGLDYVVILNSELENIPDQVEMVEDRDRERKKVVVTGCFDWLHSGHIRFFEETSALGDLYVVLGHDKNVRLLKGDGHPQFGEVERRYMVQSVRYVKQALVSTGNGWMDAEPEIERLRPHMYVVNEDGDRPEKQAFCEKHGLEYVVLRRLPKKGLPRRSSTALRGF